MEGGGRVIEPGGVGGGGDDERLYLQSKPHKVRAK